MTACGLVAQLDRVFDYESKGRGFESRRAHQKESVVYQRFLIFLSKQTKPLFSGFGYCLGIIRWLGKLEVIDNRKKIEYYPGLFDEFKVQKILDRWDKFPGIMWGLGFELDYYHSFEVYRNQSNLKLKPPHSKREERRNLLYLLEHADRQIVGNYLFSEWRKYVKCELSYDQFDLDFIFRVMDILESRYI